MAMLRQLKLLTVDACRVRWKMDWKIIFSGIFRLFQSSFDIYSCGQDHICGCAAIEVKHLRDISSRLSVYFKFDMFRAAFCSVLQILAYL